ncbi:MAG: hypothetical protein AB7F88_11190 [Pyrinomonadaceae bacterium]
MRKLMILILVAASVSAAGAQRRTFKWTSELCDISGVYDSKKYTETQLRNTLTLFGPAGVRIDFNATVWKHEDIAKLDIAELDREYERKSTMLRELDIVKTPFFEKLRDDTLKEMRQVYELSRVTARAYTQPESIKEYPRAESCKLKYGGPIIAGGEDLADAWRQVNLASQKVNGSPQFLQERFDRQNASPDRLKFALVETMAFGWWNCVNETLERRDAARLGDAEKEFRKLFTRVKEICDEP